MATVKDWTGGSGDHAWATAANWVGGAAAGAGEIAHFITGSQSLLSGHTALNATSFAGFITEPGFSGNIGASGSQLYAGMAAGRVEHRGSGELWFKAGNAFTTSMVVIDAALPSTIANIDATTSTIIDLAALRGTITCVGTGTFNNISVGYLNSPANDVTLTVASTLTAVLRLNINGGSVTTSQAVTHATIKAGQWTHDNETITDLDIYGGTCYMNYAPGSGTVAVTDCRVHAGGILDLTATTGVKKITNLTIMPGAIVRMLNDPSIHIVTNKWDLRTEQTGS